MYDYSYLKIFNVFSKTSVEKLIILKIFVFPFPRFRCMIDDSWWTGQVLERSQPAHGSQDSDVHASDAACEFFVFFIMEM